MAHRIPYSAKGRGGVSESTKSSSLKIVSWNCCGLETPETVQRLKDLHKNISPDILFLMETKNPDDFVLTELQWANYSSNKLVSPHGRGGGGLALCWNHNIELEVLSSSQNFIDTYIRAEGRAFYATFIYGEPDKSKRKEIWNKLTAFGKEREAPWILTGDFNDIIDSTEKVGGPNRPEGSFIDLRTFMSECDLYDLRHSGNFLSWRGQMIIKCNVD